MERAITRNRRGGGLMLAATGIVATMFAAPLGLAAYAHSRPASEATCHTVTDLLITGPRAGDWVRVTTCTIVGVQVSRTVTPLAGQEG